jgi:hypothetical protein
MSPTLIWLHHLIFNGGSVYGTRNSIVVSRGANSSHPALGAVLAPLRNILEWQISSDMTAILAALAMVVTAFIACVSAALGGRLRDMHP